jgi:hypothetical protein
MSTLRLFVCCLILAVGTGCAVIGNPFGSVELTPAGSAVRMRSNAADVAQCKFLGEVKGVDDVNIATDVREENAIKSLKNATAAMGGNVVLIISTSNLGSRQHGEAYHCPESATP